MAGYARYTAVFDACVLYPIVVADALVSVAVEGLFAAKWTEQIEQEYIRPLEERHPEHKGKFDSRREAMRRAIPDWEIPRHSWEKLVPCLDLPDNKDRHVLAAAVSSHADCIVTWNRKDFPPDRLASLGIEALDPDTFLINQLDLNQVTSLTAFKGMRARKKNPPLKPDEFCDRLERAGLAATANRLREAVTLI